MRRITVEDFEELVILQQLYKEAIGEETPTSSDLQRLRTAVENGIILFYGHEADGKLVAMCSVCKVFSTFLYETVGVFEDFYIMPNYRHQGIARKLVQYAYEESGIASMTVGCADCDVEMYKAIGFKIPLGNMLAYGDD